MYAQTLKSGWVGQSYVFGPTPFFSIFFLETVHTGVWRKCVAIHEIWILATNVILWLEAKWPFFFSSSYQPKVWKVASPILSWNFPYYSVYFNNPYCPPTFRSILKIPITFQFTHTPLLYILQVLKTCPPIMRISRKLTDLRIKGIIEILEICEKKDQNCCTTNPQTYTPGTSLNL